MVQLAAQPLASLTVLRARFSCLFFVIAFSLVKLGWAQTPSFSDGEPLGTVETAYIWEASGLAASRHNPGVLWTHNDSGYPGSVFALSTNGQFLGEWRVPDLTSGDFEDMALGPGPDAGLEYIYLGDIGDNDEVRSEIHVYRFPEPAVYGRYSNAPPSVAVQQWEDLVLQYPDGPFNAEGLIVDPITGDLFIFTKITDRSRVYRAARADLKAGVTINLQFVREISFRRISGAGISSDGSLIAVRRGGSAELRTRSPGQTVSDALATAGVAIPIASEPNGESIAFDPVHGGYFTLSEESSQPVNYYARTDLAVVAPRVFLPAGAVWRYDDFGAEEAADWIFDTFDDGFFAEGPAPLGYGSGEATTIYGGDAGNRIVTTYFRNTFPVAGSLPTNLALRVCFNDGVAIYLNGTEVLRRNLAPAASFEALAKRSTEGRRNCWFSVPVNPLLLKPGINLIAVEVHRADRTGAALNFDAQLVEGRAELPPRFSALPQVGAGQVTLRITGPHGTQVRIEKSADFTSWSDAGAITLTGKSGIFQEPAAATRMFYRVAE